jgi:hypothetical protein
MYMSSNITSTIIISLYCQLEKNGLLSMVFFDLLLRYMRVLMLFSSISERKMIFALYSTAVQFVPPIVDYAVPHLNKYVRYILVLFYFLIFVLFIVCCLILFYFILFVVFCSLSLFCFDHLTHVKCKLTV